MLTLISGYTPEEAEKYKDHVFTYVTETFSSDITTRCTVGETVKTHTETFTKTIVTELHNADNVKIFTAEWNSSTGKVTGYYDAQHETIHLSEWRTDFEEYPSQLTADAAAIVWAITKNQEQSASFDKQKSNYRKGIKDGQDNGGADVEEDINIPIPSPPSVTGRYNIDFNPDSGDGTWIAGDIVKNIESGVRIESPVGYCDIFVDFSRDTSYRKGVYVVKAYDSAGTKIYDGWTEAYYGWWSYTSWGEPYPYMKAVQIYFTGAGNIRVVFREQFSDWPPERAEYYDKLITDHYTVANIIKNGTAIVSVPENTGG